MPRWPPNEWSWSNGLRRRRPNRWTSSGKSMRSWYHWFGRWAIRIGKIFYGKKKYDCFFVPIQKWYFIETVFTGIVPKSGPLLCKLRLICRHEYNLKWPHYYVFFCQKLLFLIPCRRIITIFIPKIIRIVRHIYNGAIEPYF